MAVEARNSASRPDLVRALRSAASSSLPMETHVSVATTSAPETAFTGSGSTLADPPVVAAISWARARTAGSGRKSEGPETVTCIPAVAPASR